MAGQLMAGMVASALCVAVTAAACTMAAMLICLAFVAVRLLMEAAYRIDWYVSVGKAGDDEEIEG